VSRHGGDEFVILLSSIQRSEDAVNRVKDVIAKVNLPYSIDGHDLHLSVSIGISIYPDDSDSAEELIQDADNAMYHAKEQGSNNYRFFQDIMNVQAVRRQYLETGLHRALERHEFLLHYQPKVNLNSGQIVGVEALLRWRHPERGLIPPVEFIPLAESSGLIAPIGRWVLREACRQAREWRGAGLPHIGMAVNISAVEFRDKDFLANLQSTLVEAGMNPANLELELTESVLMRHVESTDRLLRELHAIGVCLTVDDFGTGYSSLSYLSRFPIGCLKIDRSFVQRINSEQNDDLIIRAVIGMGQSLNQRVVAEGVETQEQLAFLQLLGCDEGQGYYFCHPVPAQEIASLLETALTGKK
jgi:EAL domain-containing protein (putative c-di-GMP-specific phosphodiesterase class I)